LQQHGSCGFDLHLQNRKNWPKLPRRKPPRSDQKLIFSGTVLNKTLDAKIFGYFSAKYLFKNQQTTCTQPNALVLRPAAKLSK